MKKFYAILCIAVASLTQLQAQAPQGFNYQATVRNSAGDLIVNANVYFKFNVIQGSLTAVPIFTETHYVSTDDLGQGNLVIGQGTANSGSFSALDWSLASYYLGIELDTGNGYLAMGTTQLLSVPYALYSGNAQVSGFNHYIGESFSGGLIYYLYKGSDGLEHGLIVSPTESTAKWQTIATLVNADRSWDGAYNTSLMTGSPAASYISSLGPNWYLPSIDELVAIQPNNSILNRIGSSLHFYRSSSLLSFYTRCSTLPNAEEYLKTWKTPRSP